MEKKNITITGIIENDPTIENGVCTFGLCSSDGKFTVEAIDKLGWVAFEYLKKGIRLKIFGVYENNILNAEIIEFIGVKK